MSSPDRLDCHETFRLLDDYLDRELSVDEQRLVEQHLEECARCSSEFSFEANVLEQIRLKIKRVDLPADLLQKIRSRLDNAD